MPLDERVELLALQVPAIGEDHVLAVLTVFLARHRDLHGLAGLIFSLLHEHMERAIVPIDRELFEHVDELDAPILTGAIGQIFLPRG